MLIRYTWKPTGDDPQGPEAVSQRKDIGLQLLVLRF